MSVLRSGGLCVALAVGVALSAEGLRVTGDARRLFAPAGVEAAELWAPMPDRLALAPAQGEAIGSVAAIPLLALAEIHRAIGLSEMRLDWLAAAYGAVFGAGLWALWASARGVAARAGVAVAAGLILAGLADVWRSPFEEAVALALLPWLAWALTHPARLGPLGAGLLAGAGLGAKAYLPILAPALLAAAARARARWAALAAVLAALALTSAIRPEGPRTANAYNRLFHGLALTEAGVAAWPAQDWEARARLAPGRVGPAPPWLAPDLRPLWGTAFWPAALELPPARRAAAVSAGGARAMAARLTAEPRRLLATLAQATGAAIRADYRLCYLRPGPCDRPRLAALRTWGLAFALAPLALVLAAARRRWPLALAWAAIALAPTAIVLADGYYELEKHLLLMPALALLLLPGTLTPGAARASPDPAPPRRRPSNAHDPRANPGGR